MIEARWLHSGSEVSGVITVICSKAELAMGTLTYRNG